MAKQLCPVCGCTVVAGTGHEKDGVTYCCEPCASSSSQCECGCCHVAEEPKRVKPA